MITRYYSSRITELLSPGRVLVLYGPRRVGKTTLVQEFLKDVQWSYRLETGDDIRAQEILSSQSVEKLKEYAAGYDLLVIDEAQRIPNIGLGLKILVDHVPDLRIIATGSASFDLSNKVGEPLTGRKTTRVLYPISLQELSLSRNRYELKELKEKLMLFGSYPDVLTADSDSQRKEYLYELVNSYLLKDILELERVKSPIVLMKLLRLLTFQVGKDVSISELATNLALDQKTVARYLDLLEKSFVIRALPGFRRNLRKEITKSNRYYFLDNGIRNGVISNFNALENRDDVGALWENFLLSERLKKNEYSRAHKNMYFWRTYDRKEIDLIEDGDGVLGAFEFKLSKKSVSAPKDFAQAYPQSTFELINSENYLDFCLYD